MLTADWIDLNAPEGEREELYYFCLTEVLQTWPKQRIKHKVFLYSTWELQLLIYGFSAHPCVKVCRGEMTGEVCVVCTSLFLALSVHPPSFLFISVFLKPISIQEIGVKCIQWLPYLYKMVQTGQTFIIWLAILEAGLDMIFMLKDHPQPEYSIKIFPAKKPNLLYHLYVNLC